MRAILAPTALAFLATVIPAFFISSASFFHVCSFFATPVFPLSPFPPWHGPVISHHPPIQ
jgi:hypothetical protein